MIFAARFIWVMTASKKETYCHTRRRTRLGGGEVGSAVTIASTSAASAAASIAGPSAPKPGPSATIRSSDDEDSDVGSQGFSTRGST
jgi:hypothetical protein